MKKKVLLLGLFFFLFFINITGTKALGCYYQLPFVGIDGDGNVIDAQSIGCQNGGKCMIDATIAPDSKTKNEEYDNNEANFPILGYTIAHDLSAYLVLADSIRGWESSFSGWAGMEASVNAQALIGIDSRNNFKSDDCAHMDCLTNSGKFFNQNYCPKFIQIDYSTEDQRKEYGDSIYTYAKDKKDVDWWEVGGTVVRSAPSTANYVYTIINAEGHARYKDQLKFFTAMNVSEAYLPLIDFYGGSEVTSENKEKMEAYINDNFNVFKTTVIPQWYKKVKEIDDKVESACSNLKNPWYEYINFKNYKDVGHRINYYEYMNKEYSDKGLSEHDADINKGCWDARRELAVLYFTSGNYFMSAVGINRDGSTEIYSNTDKTGNKYSQFFSNDISNLNVTSDGLAKKWLLFEWNFAALNIGVDGPLSSFKSSNTDVAEVIDAINLVEEALKGYEIIKNDKCAYLCEKANVEDETDDQSVLSQTAYDYCKSNNTEYNSCSTKLKECESSIQNNCTGIGDATAKENCLKSYNDNIFNCMKTKGFTNMKSLYENALANAKKIYEKANGNLNSTVDSKKFKFVRAEPLNITWKTTKYKGNCKDVELLHTLWIAIIIAGPFLVIILGSMDYFKIVMSSGDSIKDAIKKNKKNFVRRIVALVILMLVPVLVKLLLTNFTTKEDGAQNLTLMRCIVNGK